MDDNLSKQVEEIETLCSIYGNDWVTVNEASRSYSILISTDKHQVSLYVTLPDNYPLSSSPIYELFAPELSRAIKCSITQALDTIYQESEGEGLLYQWIEKVRDILLAIDQVNQECPQGDDNVEEIKDVPVTSTGLDSPKVCITHGPVITDRKSAFQGHVAVVHSLAHVKQAISELKENKKISNATHNIYAYRIKNGNINDSFLQDCDDDGETHAGSRLMHLLQVVKAVNTLVVVSRWYGGIQLGPDRFRHINNSARQALELAGLIDQKRTH